MDKRVEIIDRATKATSTSVAGTGDARIVVPLNANVRISAPPDAVSSMVREGDDLIVKFADGSTLRLEGYFGCSPEDLGDITLSDPGSGAQWLVNLGDASCVASGDVSTEPVSYELSAVDGTAGAAASSAAAAGGGIGNGLLIGLGALAVGGGIAAAAGGGGNGGGGNGGGGGGNGGSTPPPDTTAPAVPVVSGGVQPGGATNDTTPTFSGTAEAGATITAFDSGTRIGTAIVGADGIWTFTPEAPLGEGPHNLTFVAIDAAGNQSGASAGVGFTVDTGAPAAPAVTDGVASGGATNDTTPSFSGTTEPGSVVAVFDNGTQIGTAVVATDGTWTFTPEAPLGEGPHSLTFVAIDAAGNQSAASPAIEFAVDTGVPAAPVLNPTDGTTISGTAEGGATIGLDTDGDGIADATTTAAGDGTWSITLPTPLADGTVISATAADAAGNISGPGSATVDGSIDTTPPAAPVISGGSDDADPVVAPIAAGGSTNDPTPTFGGTTEPGSVVEVFNNGDLIGNALVAPNGSWTFTPTTPLGDGLYSFTFVAVDVAGNRGAASAPFAFTIDTGIPAAPTIRPTNGALISGTAEIGATVSIDIGDDGVIDGVVQADGAGAWTFMPGSPVADGTTISVTATDAAGNISPPATVPVDSSVPVAPGITEIIQDVESGTGVVVRGGVSNDATLTINGTAEPDSTVRVYDGTLLIGTLTASPSGDWTLTTGVLSEGTHEFSVTATDETGNVSGPSVTYGVIVDLSPPALVVDPTDGTTLTGTAEAGATVLVDTNGDGTAEQSTVAGDDGRWSVIFTPPLASGALVDVVAVDPAGNPTVPTTVVVDNSIDSTPPPVPLLDRVMDDVDPSQGGLRAGIPRTTRSRPSVEPRSRTSWSRSTTTVRFWARRMPTKWASGRSRRTRRWGRAPIA
ncbi:MAG: large repetitive protein [Novosphingobium lindaniclasticum]|jgi:hypothetical protein|nr:Ig-like domain-containing protein [Novosphingobium lindaniclasticum]MDF2639097.1 large repetitive protein [Novosphingobium lindaniclasticum]